MYPKMALNSLLCSRHLLSAGTEDVHHHVWFMWQTRTLSMEPRALVMLDEHCNNSNSLFISIGYTMLQKKKNKTHRS